MFLFVDSSVLCSDYFMKSIKFRSIKKAGFHIVLSEIVIAEVKNKYRETLQDGIKKANSGIEAIKILGVDLEKIADETLNNALTVYSDYLDMFVIESGWSCPEPYPNVSHDDIVNRALLRKKPFKEDGKNGYRDYLVWRTFTNFVCSQGNKDDDYYFLTLNTSDFSDRADKTKLHSDLQEELSALNLGNKKVHYYSLLTNFFEEVIEPILKHIENDERLSEFFMKSETTFVQPITKFLESELHSLNVSDYEIPFWGENPEISDIADVEIEDIESIAEMGENEYRVQLRAGAYISFSTYICKSELAALSNRELKHINIADGNWNDHYALVENDVHLDIDVEVLLIIVQSGDSTTDGQITISAIEIESVADSSYCPYCPDYDDEEEAED